MVVAGAGVSGVADVSDDLSCRTGSPSVETIGVTRQVSVVKIRSWFALS